MVSRAGGSARFCRAQIAQANQAILTCGCFICSSLPMELLKERLVPNIVLVTLVLSFTTVTHGKYIIASYDSN